MAKGDPHVALVTGAAVGLGETFSVALADKGIGVIGVDIADMSKTAELVVAAGARFVSVAADVSDLAAMRDGVDSAVGSLGGLDIVVANAGDYPAAPLEEVTLRDWRNLMRLNLDGVFCTVQVALPHMRKAGWGRVIALSSGTIWNGTPNQTPYVTTKAGRSGFVRSLAGELGTEGITVNAITPGLISTAHAVKNLSNEVFDKIANEQVVKRRMHAEDLNSTLLYLVDEGSDMVSGQTINCDGGKDKH